MAFIGNTNQTQAFTPAVDYFNGDGTTVAFTLSRPVASVAQVQVVIENVPQNPSSAYTVSGNTITFTSAPPSGTSNIYVEYTSPITQVIAPGQGTVNTTQLGNINNINSLTSLALQTNNGTTAVTIDASQNVGIGTSSPAYKLDVNGPIGYTAQGATTQTNYFNFGASGSIGNATGSKLIFRRNYDNINLLTLDGSGNVGIGALGQNTLNRLQVSGGSSGSGTSSLHCVNSSGATQLFLRNDNYFNSGAIANYSVAGSALVIDVNNYVGKTTSSLRYKKDIVDYDKGLEAIAKLRPVYYKSAVEGPNGIDPKQHAGFIAEEIAEEGFEEFLIRNQDNEPDAIQYAQMTAILCKAIQEQQTLIEALTAKLTALELK